MSLASAREQLDILSEEVLALVDSGKLVAFDLGGKSRRRRLLRIWRGSLVNRPIVPAKSQSEGTRERMLREQRRVDYIIADALATDPENLAAERSFGTHELALLWSLGVEHVAHLASELGGQQKPRVWKFSRVRCAAFLRERLVR